MRGHNLTFSALCYYLYFLPSSSLALKKIVTVLYYYCAVLSLTVRKSQISTVKILGSLSNHDDDGNKNPTNLHIWQWKTVFLHALLVHFSSFAILETFSFFLRPDVKWGFVDDVSIWWQMFNFVFLCPKRWFQINSRTVRTHFSIIMTLNSWKMIIETRSYIFRWRSRFRRRRVCWSSLLRRWRSIAAYFEINLSLVVRLSQIEKCGILVQVSPFSFSKGVCHYFNKETRFVIWSKFHSYSSKLFDIRGSIEEFENTLSPCCQELGMLLKFAKENALSLLDVRTIIESLGCENETTSGIYEKLSNFNFFKNYLCSKLTLRQTLSVTRCSFTTTHKLFSK